MESNSAKGRNSFDITTGNTVVNFFNRNVTPYATEAGGPKFDLVPVAKQKDKMVNVARLHAQQEYERIMELVAVLQRQADDIQKRLDITDMVHQAKYEIQLAHGQEYWLAYDHRQNCTILIGTGPDDWSTGKPYWYEYVTKIRWLGDHSWTEVKND